MKLIITFLSSVILCISAWGSSSTHDAFNTLLNKYVSKSGKVNYKGFISEKNALAKYIDFLEKNPPQSSWSKNEIKAYWINAYNAFTIDLIIKNYPLKSIKDIGSPWDKKFIPIDGKTLSLNDIEHKILRVKFDDPRIHFAINCASVSCPLLRNEAFTANKLEKQLDEQSEIFINNTSKNKLTTNQISISKLFNWFQTDFTKKGNLIDFLNQYAHVKIASDADINYLDYNWNLNE